MFAIALLAAGASAVKILEGTAGPATTEGGPQGPGGPGGDFGFDVEDWIPCAGDDTACWEAEAAHMMD